MLVICVSFFFFKQKTAYEMRISDWSSDVYASDLVQVDVDRAESAGAARFDHGAGFLDALDAVDRLLHRRVEVLHAEAGAVEADVGHAGDVGGRDEARVGPDRDVASRRARSADLAAQRLTPPLQLAPATEVGRT